MVWLLVVGDFCSLPKYLFLFPQRIQKGRIHSIKFNFNSSLFHIALIHLLSSFNLLGSVMPYWLSCYLCFGVISFSS